MPLLTLPTGENVFFAAPEIEMTRRTRRKGHLKAIVKKPSSTERYSTAEMRPPHDSRCFDDERELVTSEVSMNQGTSWRWPPAHYPP
jgi:hypothetical protein